MYPATAASPGLLRVHGDDVAPPQLEPLAAGQDRGGCGVEGGDTLGHEQTAAQPVDDLSAALRDLYGHLRIEVIE
jgi:hypothetical protein